MRNTAAIVALVSLYIWASPSFADGSRPLPPPCEALVETLDNPNKDPLSNSDETGNETVEFGCLLLSSIYALHLDMFP